MSVFPIHNCLRMQVTVCETASGGRDGAMDAPLASCRKRMSARVVDFL